MKKYEELSVEQKREILYQKEQQLIKVIPDVDWKMARQIVLDQLSKTIFIEEDDPEMIRLNEN